MIKNLLPSIESDRQKEKQEKKNIRWIFKEGHELEKYLPIKNPL